MAWDATQYLLDKWGASLPPPAPRHPVMRWPHADLPGLRAWRNMQTGLVAFYARYTSDAPDRLPSRMERDYEHG